MQALIFVSSPSPPLPRKRGREQAESDATALPSRHVANQTCGGIDGI
jgi:hypothetical protein